jgi:hypothetical protein
MQYSGSVSNYQLQINFPSVPFSSTGQPFGYTRVVALYVALSGGGAGLAELYFVPGKPVPDSSTRVGTSTPLVFDLFLPLEDYTAIVDLVRNEKPIYWLFDDTTQQIIVSTDPELVGEGQGK